jgi:ABC-2 type transport system ATP-binding protein
VNDLGPGEIRIDGVARRFVVRARETSTLKELVIARGRTGGQEVWALDDVSAHIRPGEAVGLIGRNGSGKSTLLRLVAGIIKPTRGTVDTGGRIGSLLELGAGFHPDFTGRENLFLNGSIQGLGRRQIRERFEEIVAFAEIEHAIDRPVRTYSSGMTMRLGFAIAAFLDADILLLDEVFAVGDESFQRKCFGVIADFKHRGGTIVFVSHDAPSVERLCERSVLLDRGRVAFAGPTYEAVSRYRQILAAAPGEAVVESGTDTGIAVRVLGADGEAHGQFLSGEPLSLEIEVAAAEPAALLTLELRDDAGLLVAQETIPLGETGWSPGASPARLEVPASPLHFGRFTVGIILSDPATGRPLDVAQAAAAFLVYPDDPTRGLVRLGGTWAAAPNSVSR